jgi:hypothetical protein
MAREIHELALSLPREPSGKPPATWGAGAVALDTLSGAGFSPAIHATKDPIPGASGWKQAVHLDVYDLADLETPVVKGYAEIAPGSGRLYRLTVDVSARGQFLGSWWWWLDP